MGSTLSYMDLLRDWRRRILGGTAAIVLIPIVVVVGAIGVLGTGFGGLNSLGQALTGPEIPGVEPARAAGEGDTDDDAGDLLADAAVPTPGATAAPRTAIRRRAARRRGSQRPAATPTPDATDPPSGGSGGSGGGEPTPTPQPTPTPEPSTVRQVGEEVKKVTNQVPIAGEPAGQVVDTIVETAEQLPLPKLPELP